MAWENTLHPASFRGLEFEVASTEDDIERATVVHEYPYVDGGVVEDMGRCARPIRMQAVFYGEDYENRLQAFLDAIDAPGTGELIHPVFGAIQAQFIRASILHDGSAPDSARLALEFLESTLGQPLFAGVLPAQQAAAINQAADDALAAARAGMTLDIQSALNLPALVRDKLSTDMLAAIDTMRQYTGQLIEARGWVASGLYYLNNPTAFVDDVTGGLVSRVTALFSSLNLGSAYAGGSESGTGYQRGSLASVWQAPLAHLQQPLVASDATPVQALALTADPAAVQPFLVAHLSVQQAIAVCGAAAQVFSAAADESILTPDDIAIVTADARDAVNGAIALVRLIYPDIVRSRPLTEALKVLALSVTMAAEGLIRIKPQLVSRAVESDCNLHLLAHLWYGDYRRADELLRLNPTVRNPNLVARGIVLRAYAQ
jgi:prophage DNA circulation protein